MAEPEPATHVFVFRMRRLPVDPEAFMRDTIPAQEAAIKALESYGWEHSTGYVQFGSVESPQGRLNRIAEAHQKYVGEGGLTSGECVECGLRWPCPTYAWATQGRDPAMACWDPDDDAKDGAPDA